MFLEVWDVPQAVEYMKQLEPLKPWFIEEPTAPDDVVGHAAIRKALKPHGIGVATGEHAHNRVSPFWIFRSTKVSKLTRD